MYAFVILHGREYRKEGLISTKVYNVSEQRRIVKTPEEWEQKIEFKEFVKRAMAMSDNTWKGKP